MFPMAKNDLGAFRKIRTNEKQLKVDEKLKVYHAEQATLETEIRGEINMLADKAIETYKGKGRPSKLNDDLRNEIIDRMGNGQSLTSIAKLNHMPSIATIITETHRNPDFLACYSRARLLQADVLFNQMLDIADDSSRDLIKDDEGKLIVNNAAIARDKLKIETRMRMAGKLAAKYHERAPIIGDGANVTLNTLNVNARDMNPESRDQLRALLLQAKNNVIDQK